MKKILSLFAISAIMLGMASCGDGNDPEVKNIKFKVTALSSHTYVELFPSDEKTFYYTDYLSKSQLNSYGTIENYIKEEFESNSFESLMNNEIYLGTDAYRTSLTPNTEYVVFACYVKENEEKNAEMISEIFSQDFKTLEPYTLNGKFSIGLGKTVRFCTSNTIHAGSNEYTNYYDQFSYWGENGIDLHPWDVATKRSGNYRVLTDSEWLNILKNRDHASELFAHATVNGIKGLILLPDGWQTPDGVPLQTSLQMGMVWDNTSLTYAAPSHSFDGYSVNDFDSNMWAKLEFAGAVFLPAGEVENTMGNYWSSTATNENYAHGFHFDKDRLQLKALQSSSMAKTGAYSVRLVWAEK